MTKFIANFCKAHNIVKRNIESEIAPCLRNLSVGKIMEFQHNMMLFQLSRYKNKYQTFTSQFFAPKLQRQFFAP